MFSNSLLVYSLHNDNDDGEESSEIFLIIRQIE